MHFSDFQCSWHIAQGLVLLERIRIRWKRIPGSICQHRAAATSRQEWPHWPLRLRILVSKARTLLWEPLALPATSVGTAFREVHVL